MVTDAGQRRIVAGRYALVEVLGRGGMGVVWRATDEVLERQVALKEVTFPVDLTAEERDILVQRTMREARAAARLDHPAVTRVYDVVQEDGKPWLVMEYFPSRSLLQVVEEGGPIPAQTAARIGLDVLSAIDAAHSAGIVHRDVKPGNVLVGPDGRACLTDFGIATTTGDSQLTAQGALVGSPTYMAPERARGDVPRPAVDLWGLGATLYAAVEGRPPFDRGEPMSTLFAVVSDPPAPMLRAGPLEPVLLTLLDKDPDRRGTVASVRGQLEAVASGTAPAAPPAPAAAAAGPAPAQYSAVSAPAQHPQTGAPPSTPPPPPPTPAATPPAPRPAVALRESSVQRFDADDLRKLASASKKVLGVVAREAGRELVDRRRERKGRPPVDRAAGEPSSAPLSRWRFKRRWVVVPVVVTVVLFLALVVAAGLAAGWWLDLY
jgi:serine/threonine protein kinase